MHESLERLSKTVDFNMRLLACETAECFMLFVKHIRAGKDGQAMRDHQQGRRLYGAFE